MGTLYDDMMDPVGALKRHNPVQPLLDLPGAATDTGTAQGRYETGKIGAGELGMAYGTYGLKLAEAATMIYGAGKALRALSEAEGIVGACKGECFVAGTLVNFAHMDKVGQWQVVSRPIETAHKGDSVVSRSEATGKTEVKRIVSTSHSRVDMVVRVELADAKSGRVVETITGTRRHPFYVEGKGFVPAGALAIGNSIVTRAGPPLIVKSVTWKRRAQGYNVYNFVVEDDHTYFVGEAHGGVWVHNVDCPIVNDPKLKNIAKDLYKGANTPNPIGTGSTADAVRSEMQTGLPVGTTNPAFHSTKARQYAQALEKWLSGNPHADAHDRLVAQTLRDDLRSALKGK